MKEIKLTRGYTAIVDDEDFEELNKLKWQAHGCRGIIYARHSVWDKIKKKTYFIHMHRLILGLTNPSIKADHINRNSLDNRKVNLRKCTIGQNNCNITSRKGSSSKYLGVAWSKKRGMWCASVRHKGKVYYALFTHNEKEAALAYNKKALELHGEFAGQNII